MMKISSPNDAMYYSYLYIYAA